VGTFANEPTGDEDRFRALYAAHLPAILGFALRRVAAAEDAADVVAETFLIAWRRRDDVPPDGEARLWLYGVARRVLANQVRGEGRRSRLGERLRTELSQQVSVPDPAEEVVQVRTIRTALTRLERADREVLELTAWEQLAPREIAVTLGLPPEVVRTRLSRARARLREQLQDSGSDREDSGNDSEDSGNDRAGPEHVPGVRSAFVPKEVQ
jgi:RNA polymerase sigma factor (sigma-70 family)